MRNYQFVFYFKEDGEISVCVNIQSDNDNEDDLLDLAYDKLIIIAKIAPSRFVEAYEFHPID